MTDKKLSRGWGWPANSKKAHYFSEGDHVSACQKWMFMGDREDALHDHPDNCALCNKRRRKHEADIGKKKAMR